MKSTQSFFIILLFIVSISPAATINVNSGSSGCTLFFAILSANADNSQGGCNAGSGTDVIIVPAGGSVTLSNPLPNITTPMTIRTPTNSTAKYTIDAGGDYSEVPGSIIHANNYRIFNVLNSNNVILENLIVTNSIINTVSFTGGAAIKINNSEVNLNGVEILYNYIDTGTQIGAGVRILNNSTVSFEQCSFADNRLSNNASGTANPRGGNLAIEDSVVTINNTEIKGYFFDPVFNINGGSAEKGAGIYADNSDLTLSNTLFTNNRLISSINHDEKGSDLYAINNCSIDARNTTFFQTSNVADNVARVYIQDSFLNFNNVTLWGDPVGGGIELYNSSIASSNSLFVHYPTGNPQVFCHAYNALGNVLNFSWVDDTNNLAAQGDTSCNITPLPPAQINFLPTVESYSDYIESPADNGGLTKTSRLAPAYNPDGDSLNLAINNGDNASCEPTDQRGIVRDACDIGAYELNDVADLAVDMSIVTSAPYYKGQRIEYAIDVSNLGPSAIYGADVFIDVSGLNIDSWQTNHNCVLQNTSNLNCTISNLINGGNTVIYLFAIKDATATFDGNATVQNFTNFSTDPIISNNSDNSNNGGTTSPAADLKITQTLLTAPPYNINQNLTYQIVLDNLGPNTANNIILTHTLTGLSNSSYTGCNSSTATTCTITALGNTQSRTITFKATINANLIKNTVTVISNEFDPKILNNTAKNKNTISTNASLKAGGSISPSAPYYNEDIINYNYIITNLGPDTATNVVIDFSTSLNQIISGSGGACSNYPCTIASINVGDDVNFSFQTIILASGQFSADMTALADQTDSNLSDNSVNITKTAGSAVDLNVTLTLLSSPPFYAGQTLTFEAKINNAIENTSATSPLVENQLLDNLSIDQVSSPNCNTFPCTINNLDYGLNNQEIITINARIDSAGDFTYTLKATATEHETDYSYNSDTVTDTAVAIPQENIFSDGFEN